MAKLPGPVGGKPLRARFWGENIVEIATSRASPGPHYPASPVLLGRAISSILERFRQIIPGHEKHVRDLVKSLAFYERVSAEDGILREKFYQQIFTQMADPRLPRGAHWLGSLGLQSDVLVLYFKNNHFPSGVMKQNPKLKWIKKLEWINNHLRHIRILLESFPCYCDYPGDLSPIFENSPETLPPNELKNRILAEMHYTTPANIEKLLKKRAVGIITPKS